MSFAFMPIYTGDYLRDTKHLTPEEHGVYLLLLLHCWDQKGPVPRDERRQCGIVNARSGGEIESMRRVLTEFFTLMDDGWYNKRMSEEIAKAEQVSAHRRAGGYEKARRQRDKLKAFLNQIASSSAQAMHEQSISNAPAGTPTPTPTLTPNLKVKSSSALNAPVPTGFAAFWSAYPNLGRRKNKAACLALWKSQGLEGEAAAIVAHVEGMKRTPGWCPDAAGDHFEPEAERYLRKRNWEDGLPDNVSRRGKVAL